MKIYYDFHIHSCLSPCGDNDMTPNNIVNMALIKGLNAIAITDHNSFHNVEACVEAACGTGLVVIPGMEVETSEEIHVVTLFPDCEAIRRFGQAVTSALPMIKNKPAIFGEQIIMNSDDDIVGFEERFLITATTMSIYDVCKCVKELNGVAICAHIDKSSYSVISSLGCIPDDLDLKTVEVKKKDFFDDLKNAQIKSKYNVVHNSDAHYLWDISEKDNYLECESNTIECILHSLSVCKQV